MQGPGEVAIKVKGTTRVDRRDLRLLAGFVEGHSLRAALVVGNEPEERIVDGILILPWSIFLKRLWQGAIIS